MKRDRAARFVDRTLRHESRESKVRYADWGAFYAAYTTNFCPANEATTALMRLETRSYFQNKRDVDEYVDEFEELIDMSGYSDPLVIVIKFRRGLNPTTQDKIAELGSDRPSDSDPEKWYAMARRLDQNRLANEAFQASNGRPQTVTTTPTAARSVFPRALVQPQLRPTPAPTPMSRPTQVYRPNVEGPRAPNPPRACFRCGSLEHLAPQCPTKLDIRAMTSDERESLLEDLLAAKDVAEEAEGEVQNEEEAGRASEDFAQHSG